MQNQLSMSIKVALVEDDAIVLSSMVRLIEHAQELELAWVAETMAQAMYKLETVEFDVLLVDLGLPDGSGISIIRRARNVKPNAHIMVSTVFGDEAHVIQAIEAGASGYVLKDNSSETLIQEIRQLHAGGSPISPIIARLLLRRFQTEAVQAANNPTATTSLLSPRETEVLQLMTKGFSYSEIARLMDVRLYTIHTFVRRMYAKLDVSNKIEAIHEARLMGLLDE